jgi:putative transposase
VVVEDLKMKAMSQCLNFGKSVSDNGWGMYLRFVEYKQDWRSQHFIKIEKQCPSTRLCHVCRNVNDQLTLSDREWTCDFCGTHHLRDLNAVINIRNRGLELLAEQFQTEQKRTGGYRGLPETHYQVS